MGAVSWADIANLLVAVAALGVTIGIFVLGRRLTFPEKRARVAALREKAWKVLGPIRRDGLNSRIIVMNSARYARGYDGSNEITWRGQAYSGPEIIEIRHGGIQVITGYDARSSPNADRLDPNAALEIGHIPWEWIDDIDPEGDEYSGSGIFFVRHRAPGWSPYNYHTYVSRNPVPFGPNSRDYYRPLEEYGTRRPRFFADWIGFLRVWIRDARMNRRTRREGL